MSTVTTQYTTYQPRAGSVPSSVCDYFRRQPEEALSPKDISIKWDIPHASVHTCLKPCVLAGLLVRDEHTSEYRAGPMLQALEDTHHALATALAGAPARPRATRRPPMALPDPAQTVLVVEAGVPVPSARTAGRSAVMQQWLDQFTQLEVGCRLRFPRQLAHRLGEIARRHGKAAGRTYVLRNLSNDESAIWRTA